MLNYKDFIKFFGSSLEDKKFQSFLISNFNDLTGYNIFDNYMVSELAGIEIGFKNNDAVYDDDTQVIFEKGNPIFSHLNLYPKSGSFIEEFPFQSNFKDSRNEILAKAGEPDQTKQGFIELLNEHFLNDNYKIGDVVISFSYDPGSSIIQSIQVRDNNLCGDIKI